MEKTTFIVTIEIDDYREESVIEMIRNVINDNRTISFRITPCEKTEIHNVCEV